MISSVKSLLSRVASLVKLAPSCACQCHSVQPFSTQHQVRLEYIGSVQPLRTTSYNTGQMFVHRLFGYRGTILAAYPSRLYQKNQSIVGGPPEVEFSNCVWYLILKDTSNVVPNLVDGLTFIPYQRDSSMVVFPGVDYCNHGDIVPYQITSDLKVALTTQQKTPIENEFYRTFFQSNLEPSNDLNVFLEERKRLLEVCSVHQEVTENVRVTSIPFFMGKRGLHYYWRYVVRLENLEPELAPVVLRERCWNIMCVNGLVEKVKDRGVVGQEPLLNKSTPLFQYYSHISLKDKWGNMGGHFRFERPDSRTYFDVKIPSFPLQSVAPDQEIHSYT